MGALIVLGITAQDGQVSTISTGIYLAFLIIMLIGAAATMTILPLHKIVRADGTAGKSFIYVVVGSQAKIRADSESCGNGSLGSGSSYPEGRGRGDVEGYQGLEDDRALAHVLCVQLLLRIRESRALFTFATLSVGY